MKALVGYTGFVGSNISNSTAFDNYYNSKNIQSAYQTKPNLLVYSGLRAEKFLANKYPEEDFNIVQNAIENIKQINPKSIVLMSTIDVYATPYQVDEDTLIETQHLQPYGANRYFIEKWVEENFEDRLIVRLPGLYGKNIKKNFIYDLIQRIPLMLTTEKMHEISKDYKEIYNYYTDQNNGFFKGNILTVEDKKILRTYFSNSIFSATNFTDSRAKFQFYNLEYLWEHINIALDNNIKLLNLATEPVSISELYEFIEDKPFINEISNLVPNYDYKTKYSSLFSGNSGYIFNKEFVMNDIKKFVRNFEVL